MIIWELLSSSQLYGIWDVDGKYMGYYIIIIGGKIPYMIVVYGMWIIPPITMIYFDCDMIPATYN